MNQIAKNVKKDHILYICSSSLIFLLVISALILSHTTLSAHADDSVITTTSITVSESCSMTGTVDTPHTAELPNGTYSGTNHPEGIGTTTLKAFCNDGMGFAIYAIGYTDDIYGYTTLHSEEIGSNYDINTALYQTGNTNSSWSMKLTSIPGDFAPTIANGTNEEEDFTTWHVVPNDYKKVAYKTTGTDILVNNVGTGSSLTVTYDAYISPTQPAGTYVGQVKYTLVHPSTAGKPELPPLDPSDCPANSICYAPNAFGIVGTMVSTGDTAPTLITISSKYPTSAKQTQTGNDSGQIVDIASNSTAQLIAPNYARKGYGFAGWSTDFSATDSSIIYGPNETIATGDLSTNGLILYPVWIASKGNLQGWSGCNDLTQATYDSTNSKMVATLSSVTALTDTRDDNVYAVARLADGKCWMIENLRLNAENSSNSSLAQGFGDAFVGLADSEDTNFGNNATANSLYSTTNITGSDQVYRFPRYNKNNTNMASGATNSASVTLDDAYNTSNDHVRWYSYGNYYSWVAAMANTGNLNSYTESEGANTSLCPTGWHLPYGNSSNTGNTAGGFYYLNTLMANNTSTQGSKDWRSFPNNFIYSGDWNGTQAHARSSGGYYWSSSADGFGIAFSLYLRSSRVYPGTDGLNKYPGLSVRCVAGS